ncbi:RICIN domain-containing protein [Streptomyces sp. 11x1]|nr:RICIN domain-containing protein [Streptomyces sp. 11x1]
MAVPFLVGGDGEDARAVPPGATPGTVLGSQDGGVYGAVGSASPSPGGSAGTVGPGGRSSTPRATVGAGAGAGAGAGTGASKSGGGGKSGGQVTGRGGASSSSGKTSATAGPTSGTKSPTGTKKKKPGGSSGSTQVARVSVRSHATGRCIDVTGAGGDGTPLQIWDCNGSAQQSWRFMSDGTVRALGLCMDVAWGATGNGAVIQLATCSGNPAQQFRLNSAHDLVNPRADKCVDVKDRQTGNGTRLQLWDCNGRDHQKWSRG